MKADFATVEVKVTELEPVKELIRDCAYTLGRLKGFVAPEHEQQAQELLDAFLARVEAIAKS